MLSKPHKDRSWVKVTKLDEGLNWPRIVAEDIVRHTQQLQNKMFMMTGKIQGKPLLPLPEHLVSWEDSGAALDCSGLPRGITLLPSSLVGPIDGTVLHSIETVVIEWFQLVEEIFSRDPAQQLQEGLHPLPKVEFDFWQTRVTSLQCISEQVLSHPPVARCPRAEPPVLILVPLPQLVTPQVTGLAKALEKADSCYWPSLQNMIRAVNGGEVP
nr:dynein heavy chain 17, axonemal-like [Zonotrichia albicollis]